MHHFPIQRVLISVSDKRGIVEFAKKLNNHGVEILSTGGTAALLKKHLITHIEVSEYTQSPEMMDGRVKTLHPKIHAGILARKNKDEADMAEQNIPFIDAVVVNLYPFRETIQNPEHTLQDAIENIDIGGPGLIRAAAKNHERLSILVDPNDYPLFLEQCEKDQIDHHFRFKLAQKAFSHTAAYDSAIANYLGCINPENLKRETDFPLTYHPVYYKQEELRYGENPHQKAAVYGDSTHTAYQLIQGKPLSFNNIADADAAINIIRDLDTTEPACVIIKHANACGVAIRNQLIDAYKSAYSTDSSAAFGGIIALNKTLTAQTAQHILETQFVEVILATQVEPNAVEILKQKPNVRVFSYSLNERNSKVANMHYKKIHDGLLIQSSDTRPSLDLLNLQYVTEKKPTEKEMADLAFAWNVVKNIQSNAIIYAKDLMTIGIGAGQMSRIDSVRIGLEKAKQANFDTAGAVMASDAFFPFRDSIDMAAKAGISAIIQPGGSMRDKEVINAANELDIAMVFTGVRHFRH